MPNEEQPDPKIVAQQLRQPSGDLAGEIGKKMNQANKPLYDLLFEVIEVEDGEQVLEIGFGNGAHFEELFSIGNDLNISGIDYSEKMVEEAREKGSAYIDQGRLDIVLGNSEALPYPDETFDLVFCNMVIYFWDEPGQHIEEVLRVLKPGGRFLTGLRTRDSMLIFPFVEYGFNLYTLEEWIELLREHDFEIEQTHTRTDPQIELDGRTLNLESCCIVARKAV